MNLTLVIDQYLLILMFQVTSSTKYIFGKEFLFPAGPSNHAVYNLQQAGHCETVNLMTESLEKFLSIMEMKKKKQLLHAYYATVQIYIPPISVNGKNETR